MRTPIVKQIASVYDSQGMGKTATQAAKELGCSVATVTRWARTLGVGKQRHGYAMVLTREEIRKIGKSWKPTRGCKPKV